MSQLRSHNDIECIVSGHRFVGWSDDDPPYDIEIEESSERKRGHDGTLYGLSMPSYGGTFTWKMSPNSPTTRWAIIQEQMRKNAERQGSTLRIYRGTFRDLGANMSMTLEGGVIVKIPPWSKGQRDLRVHARVRAYHVGGRRRHLPASAR